MAVCINKHKMVLMVRKQLKSKVIYINHTPRTYATRRIFCFGQFLLLFQLHCSRVKSKMRNFWKNLAFRLFPLLLSPTRVLLQHCTLFWYILGMLRKCVKLIVLRSVFLSSSSFIVLEVKPTCGVFKTTCARRKRNIFFFQVSLK